MKLTFTRLGSLTRACLTTGQRGKVLAAFSKAIYLLTDADELFWIATDATPMHRRCAQTLSPLPGLVAGSPFHVQDQRLVVSPDFIFDIDLSSAWSEPYLNSLADIAELPSRIHSFFSYLDLSQAKGFGNFIPQIFSLSTANFTDPVLCHAQPLVLEIASACREHQPDRIPSLAEKLIGLGAGLTPSGDDFLGGMFFALHQLQAAYPESSFAVYSIPLEPYHSQTHLISFTLLNDLTHGHAVAPLHHIVNSLLSGDSFETVEPYFSQLTRIGHSTGWDLLTGLLVGLLTANGLQSLQTLDGRPQQLEMLDSISRI